MILDELIFQLPSMKHHHARTTDAYASCAKELRSCIESLFKHRSIEQIPFGPFGKISFPYFNMGNRDSLDLFDLDELIIFSFYWVNRNRYKRVLDIGANIGLHSLILAKCGFQVSSFEPDPVHFKELEHVLAINQVEQVLAHCAAVSNRSGQARFIRVLGNTTASHLAGCKNSYGDVEELSVPLTDIRNLIGKADLIKMDAEGHEDEMLLATKACDWESVDALVEVGSPDKARAIYEHFNREGVNLFTQKINWQKVSQLQEIPVSPREGSLFISQKSVMPWE